MIQFEHVFKSFNGQNAIEDLTLHIPKGRLTVLIGSSGSGKSTTLKMVNRMVEHDAGRILFEGEEIRSFSPETLRRRMGYAIQSVGLFPHWTVAQNIATVPRLLKWSKAQIQERVDELLTMLSLPPEQYCERYPHELSGGQQQRVGVARALAANPEILLMDEPFGALDPVTRHSLQHEIKRIQSTLHKTVLLVTHDMDEALFLADHLVIMQAGRVVQQGTPLDIVSHPKDDFVREFIGRSDLGIKLVSLQTVEERMRRDFALDLSVHNANAVRAQDSLKDALSVFLAQQVAVLPVVDAQQQVVGQLHFEDLVGAEVSQS